MAGKSTDRSAMAVKNMPVRIAAVYLVIGILWIIFSDRLAEQIAADVPTLTLIQTYKGWFYVSMSTILLYWIASRYDRSVKVSEEKLIESRRQYKGLVEHVDDWIVSTDADWKVVYASPRVRELLGYEHNEIIGKEILEVLNPEEVHLLKHDVTNILNKRKVFKHLQVPGRRKDGGRVHLELSGTPRSYNSEFTGYCMIVRDITKQKKAQDTLKESETLFKAVTEATAAGIFIIKDERFVYANEAAERITGYHKDEIPKLRFLDIIAPAYKELVQKRYAERLTGKQVPSHYEIEIIKKDGDRRWIDYFGAMIKYQGRPAILGSAFDVTERKKAESAVHTSEIELSTILSSMTDLVFVLDIEGRYLKIGPSKSPLLNIPREELLGKTMREVLLEDQADLFIAYIRKALKTKKAQNLEYTSIINGKERWLSAVVSPLTESTVVWAARDTTERKRIEQDLRDSRETYRSVAQTASDAIITIDEKSKMLFVNDAIADIFGYGREELIGKPITMLMPERFRKRHLNSLQAYLETGKRHTRWRNLELSGLHKYDYEVPIEVSYGEFIKGGHHFFTGIIRDVTGRKTVEDALKESEGKYRKLVESANDAIIIADIDSGKIIDVNKRAEELLDRPADELIGQKQTILHPTGEDQRYHDFFERAVKSGQMIAKDLYVRRKDGSRVPVEISSSVTDLKGRKIVQGIFRDITERKQSEEALKNKDAQIRKTYVDVFSAVTGGRLIIMTEEELNEVLGEPVSDKIEIPSYEALSEARHIIKNTVNFNFPTIDRVDDIITAVNEALTNAVKHAGNGSLRIFESKKTAQIMISDNGPGIDFSILPKATLLSGFSTKQSLGMGFSIMLEYSDRLLLSTKPGQTIIVLEVNI